MTGDHNAKQAFYAKQRREHTGTPHPTTTITVTLTPDELRACVAALALCAMASPARTDHDRMRAVAPIQAIVNAAFKLQRANRATLTASQNTHTNSDTDAEDTQIALPFGSANEGTTK